MNNTQVSELVAELKTLYLKPDGGDRAQGLFYRVNRVIGGVAGRWDGQVDQDTKLICRIKEIIEELERLIK